MLVVRDPVRAQKVSFDNSVEADGSEGEICDWFSTPIAWQRSETRSGSGLK